MSFVKGRDIILGADWSSDHVYTFTPPPPAPPPGVWVREYLTATDDPIPVVNTTVAEAIGPAPEAVEVAEPKDVSVDIPSDYKAAMDALGYAPVKMQRRSFKQQCDSFMRRNEFIVYPTGAVTDYLDKMVDEINKREGNSLWSDGRSEWKWTALRLQDKRPGTTALYEEEVPVEALNVAVGIQKAWSDQMTGTPSKVYFDVTKIVKSPDPFLRVSFVDDVTGAKASYVVAHWDEPGFSILGDDVEGDNE